MCVYVCTTTEAPSFFPENSAAMRETLGRPEARFFCGSLRPKLKSESDQKLFFPSRLLLVSYNSNYLFLPLEERSLSVVNIPFHLLWRNSYFFLFDVIGPLYKEDVITFLSISVHKHVWFFNYYVVHKGNKAGLMSPRTLEMSTK